MSFFLKFICCFSGLAIFISLFSALIGGLSFFDIIYTTFFSTIVASILGAGVYQILDKNVPEAIQFLENITQNLPYKHEHTVDKAEDAITNKEKTSEDIRDPLINSLETPDDISEDISSTPSSSSKEELGEYGTHILVDKYKIKNEPKLMAEAVRTMVARDEKGEIK